MKKVIFDSQTVYMMTDDQIMSEIASRLRRLREGCGYSQEEFAARAGVSRETIKRIENHKVSDIGMRTMLKILRAGYMLDGIPELVQEVPDPIFPTKEGGKRKRFGPSARKALERYDRGVEQEHFKREITAKAKKLLDHEDRAFLYGSRARGDASPDSDWDILILTGGEHTHEEKFNKYIYPLVLLGQENNNEISVQVYSDKEWEENNPSTFYRNVMKDKIQLI